MMLAKDYHAGQGFSGCVTSPYSTEFCRTGFDTFLRSDKFASGQCGALTTS